jgi:alkylation response protein AidB-like acyl-CoA dehydrogenase
MRLVRFALTAGSFTGAAALVGIFGVALMRAAFDIALQFARTERRGGVHPAIELDLLWRMQRPS